MQCYIVTVTAKLKGGRVMVTIEIDEEVHNYLKSKAEPFVDTPNSVLRRLLFSEKSLPQQVILTRSTKESTMKLPSKDSGAASEVFMSSFLQYRYGVNRHAIMTHFGG
jgi:negative regulator of replication initiation